MNAKRFKEPLVSGHMGVNLASPTRSQQPSCPEWKLSSSSPDRRTRYRSKAAFTLVELLGVIAVIALLMALTVSNVGDLGKSRNLANAGSSVRDIAAHARNAARSHNSLTMFVTPTEGADAYRVFSVFERTYDSTTWKQITKWERLPLGVILDQTNSDTFVSSVGVGGPSTIKQNGTDKTYAKVLFQPNGSLMKSSVAPKLYFRQETDSDGINYYRIVFNPTTGIPIVERP